MEAKKNNKKIVKGSKALSKIKHRQLLKSMSGKLGNKKGGLTNVMIKEGYSKSYADSGHIKQTKSWNETLAEIFPEEMIAKKHLALLNAKDVKQMHFFHKMKDDEIREIIEAEGFRFIGVKRFMTNAIVSFVAPDTIAQDRALDKLYKLKSLYGATTIVHKFGELTDEELEAELAREVSEGIGDEEGTTSKKKFK